MKVVFQLNPKLDLDIAINNIDKRSIHGIDPSSAIWGPHPELKKYSSEDSEKIGKYIETFYTTDTIEEAALGFEKEWRTVEQSYAKLVEELFEGYKFPKEENICFISMFNRNIRVIEHNFFQMFYKENKPKLLIAHELLHFIFYDYTSNITKDLTKDLNINNGPWWDAAEVFNNVVLSSCDFTGLLDIDGDRVYPVHENYIVDVTNIFKHRESIKKFVEDLLIYFIRQNK